MEPVGDVLLGRAVTTALRGDRVDDDRAAEGLGPAQRELHGREVVTVDGTDVLDAEVLEEPLGRDDVLDALLQAVQSVVGQPAGRAAALEGALAPAEHLLVPAG